jgi:hypothetical protein
MNTGSTRLPNATAMSRHVESPYSQDSLSPSATRRLRLCVPDEWYRRSRFRKANGSTSSFEPSEDTIKRLASLQEALGEDEGEGTAKQKDAPPLPSPPSQSFNASTEWRGTVAQNRLSNLFGSWGAGSSPESPLSPPERKSVSEPRLVKHSTGRRKMLNTSGNTSSASALASESESEESEPDSGDFEEMLVSFRIYIVLVLHAHHNARMNLASKETNERLCTIFLLTASAIFSNRTRRFARQQFLAPLVQNQNTHLKHLTPLLTVPRVLRLSFRASCLKSRVIMD